MGSIADRSIRLRSRGEPTVAPAGWAAAPDMALCLSCIASAALNVGGEPFDFGDLLCYLLSDAF